MAVDTTRLQVAAIEDEPRHCVVIEFVVTRFEVTTFTVLAQTALVHVVVGVTTRGGTILRGAGVLPGWVAVFTAAIFMLAFERPFGVFIMRKFERSPCP